MSTALPNPDDDQTSPPSPMPEVKPHRAVTVLVLGILGLAVLPIAGIIAWVMGNRDLRRMKQGAMDPSGRDLTLVGKILGIAATMKDGLLWSMIIGVIITPTWDPMSMYIVGIPLMVVSEAAIGIVLLVESRRRKSRQ